MGERNKAKGRVGRRQGRQAPLRTPQRQGQAATSRASPQWAPTPQVQPVPLPAQARGCKGLRPLHKKAKNLPLPAGKGAGGMGAESKLKAGAAGDKQGKPPLRIPERQGQPTTSRASPPITPAPHMPPAGRRQCGQNPAGRRDSRRTRARPHRRKWRAERYREHG